MLYSKSCDLEDEQRYPKLFHHLLKQSPKSIDLFVEALQQNCDADKVKKLQTILEQYR